MEPVARSSPESIESALSNLHLQSENSVYRDLDHTRKEIRILVVQPGDFDTPIQASFAYTYLVDDDPHHYETISYVWGDPSVRSTIYIDGDPLDVPVNADIAIKRMRDQKEPRALWIDAVCINQPDLQERANQVALMAEIFTQTARNLIWLGYDNGGRSKESIHAILTILEDMKHETQDFKHLETIMFGSEGDRLQFSQTGLSRHVDWNSVSRFFQSSWFTRVWMIQEVALPRNSICFRGSSQIPLRHVSRAAFWIWHKWQASDTGWPTLPRGITCAIKNFDYADADCGWHFMRRKVKQKIVIRDIFNHGYGYFDVSDPRDHIYGKLGLYKKMMGVSDLPPELVPDYHLPFQEVFCRAARLIITQDCHLNILSDVRRNTDEKHDAKLPSWVPRWHRKYDPTLDESRLDTGSRSIIEGVYLDISTLGIIGDPKVLSLKGITLGTVARTSPQIQKYNSTKEGLHAWRTLIKTARDLPCTTEFHTSIHLNDNIAHSLIGGRDGHYHVLEPKESADFCRAFLHHIFKEACLPPPLHSLVANASDRIKKATSYFHALRYTCMNRRLFATDTGHFGVGPAIMKPGDLVVIFFGGRKPCILRPIDLRQGRYELVGTSFISEVMAGEAIVAWKDRGDVAEIFHLQ